ncbi:MAG: PKD domain-containing protein [Saprospiraceae bacterium]
MKNLLSLFFGLTLFFFSQSLYGTHVVGGEMTYECIGADPAIPGNNIYIFSLRMYRDCFGGEIPLDGTGAPNSQNASLSIYQSGNLTGFPFDEIELLNPVIDTINPSENNPCIIVPPGVCVERGVYTMEKSLPILEDESYFVVYQRCCRNGTINNIVDPGETGASYFVEIVPNNVVSCNSSPLFNQLPPPVICAGFPLSYDHSADDPDGDQLVYSFCAPVQGGATNNPNPNPDLPPPYNPVNFVTTSFSATFPLGGNPLVTIDPITGIITGTPIELGQYVVGICVQEFRNGVLIGEIRRDFQFNVAVCEEQVNANIDGVDIAAGEAFAIYTCNDSVVTIINESTDEMFIDEYEWQFDLDDNPLNPLNVWDTRDVEITFPGVGFYQGLMILNPGTECSDTAAIEVTISPPMFPSFVGVYDTCEAGPVLFENTTNINGAALDFYEWEFGDLNKSDDENPEYEYDAPGIYNVKLTATDSLGCIYQDSMELTWQPAPEAIIFQPSESVGCPPLEVNFKNLSFPIDSTYETIWTFGDDSTSFEISPTHTYQIPGNFDIHVQVTSPIGCFEEAFFPRWIDVDSLPVADFNFEPPSYITNFNPTVQFHDRSRRAAFWAWEFGTDGDLGSTLGTDPEFTFPDTGFVDVQLAVMHYYGCVDTIVKSVEVIPRATYFLPNAFTPNNDGLNEDFRGGGYFRGITNFEMVIWDRYGGVVFKTDDPMMAWNGKVNNTGRQAPNGSYVCIVRYTDPRGEQHEEKVITNLIR